MAAAFCLLTVYSRPGARFFGCDLVGRGLWHLARPLANFAGFLQDTAAAHAAAGIHDQLADLRMQQPLALVRAFN